MIKNMKIIIPMAGLGSRMRPLTWSKPKPLLPLAGRTVLDHALNQFDTLPNLSDAEYVFIISPNQGSLIQDHMRVAHPNLRVHFVLQEEMKGQSHALWLAHKFLHGPMLMAFSDTLIETDLGFLQNEPADVVAWVKPMDDPRRFGVIELNHEGRGTHLVEKPVDLSNNLVLVGFYYFKDGVQLIRAIEEQMRRGDQLRKEYYLADAVNILIEQGADVRCRQTSVWLDAGIPSALLETNRYLLDQENPEIDSKEGVRIIPPVAIADDAVIDSATIGPHVSIGSGCRIRSAVLRDSILDGDVEVEDSEIEGSLLGRSVTLRGVKGKFILGDNSSAEI